MKQAWDTETVGLHSDDGNAFPPPIPEKGGKIPAAGHRPPPVAVKGKRALGTRVNPLQSHACLPVLMRLTQISIKNQKKMRK